MTDLNYAVPKEKFVHKAFPDYSYRYRSVLAENYVNEAAAAEAE